MTRLCGPKRGAGSEAAECPKSGANFEADFAHDISLTHSMDSNLESEKSSFSSFFLVSKFAFEPWRKWSFLHPLGLSFCMRSLKCLKFPRKPPKPQPAGHIYEQFEKLTPEILKMSFFMKFKTSPNLPPYYSIESMKYALRVILLSQECFLMIPEAPQTQIETQSRNLKIIIFIIF